MASTNLGLEENIEGALAYVLGLITGIIFYVSEEENKFVRFHAMQSIILSGILIVIGIVVMILSTLLTVIPFVGWAIGMLLSLGSMAIYLVGMVIALFLLVKAYQGEKYELPVLGDLAKKHV